MLSKNPAPVVACWAFACLVACALAACATSPPPSSGVVEATPATEAPSEAGSVGVGDASVDRPGTSEDATVDTKADTDEGEITLWRSTDPPPPKTKFTDLPDTFSLRLGAGWVFSSSTKLALGVDVLQGQIDWENTLGGDQSAYFWRADASFRFSPFHSLNLTHYGVQRSGYIVVQEEIEIGEEIIPAGASLSSELEIYLANLYYTYSFYRSEKAELGLNAGFYLGYVGISGVAAAGFGGVSESIDASQTILLPIPALGLSIQYHILERLTAFFETNWFYFEAFGWGGSMVDLIVGLEYRLFDHLAIGAAFNRFDIGVDGTFSTSGTVQIENDWNALLGYVTLYF
jgi:hypothetical protein